MLFLCSLLAQFTERDAYSSCSSPSLLILFGTASNQICTASPLPRCVWPQVTSMLAGFSPCLNFPISYSHSLCPWFFTWLHTHHSLDYFFPLPDGFLSVFFAGFSSSPTAVSIQVPQDSELRQLLFLFTHFLGDFIELHTFNFHLYAYESQISISNMDISQVLSIHHLHSHI